MLFVLIAATTAIGMLIHEMGHLTAARNLNITCSEVALGLGPKVLSVRVRGVEFSLRLIPLGSFVRLDGTQLKNSPYHIRFVCISRESFLTWSPVP
jgi:regulator of sigma E protease